MPITSKTFDVLVVLLEQRERIVSKDELLDRVWPGTAVNENNLARQVSSLRRALGQRADDPDFIVTVPGHGYRFVAAVQLLNDEPTEPAAEIAAAEPDAASPRDEDFEEPGLQSGTLSSISQPRQLAIARLLGMTALVLVCACVGLLMWHAPINPGARRNLQRITYDDASLPRDASWSPDGQWIVYTSDRDGNPDLWKQKLDDPDPVRLTASPVAESQPHWSPDGRLIVFRSERDGGGLYVMPANGGPERRIASFGYVPRWSPDGTRILFTRSKVLPDLPTIYVVGLDGQPPRPVRPDVLGQFNSVQVAWHPDAKRISVWAARTKSEMTFATVPIDGGNVTTPEIPAGIRQELSQFAARQFVWAPSRRYVYFEGVSGDTRNIWRVAIDPVTEAWRLPPERLTTGTEEETSVAISPDGTRVMFTARSSTTRVWGFPFDAVNGRVTGEPEPMTQGSTAEVDFDVSPDGSKVVYRAVRAGRNELWERSIGEGRERLMLASTDARLAKPFWSHDGSMLAFLRCGRPDNRATVGVVNADGTGSRVLASARRVEMQGSDWSRDGQAILGACRFTPSERYATCLVPTADVNTGQGPVVRVLASDPKSNLFNQRFSPNQRWISFLAHDLLYASTSTLYVVPAAGGPWRAITEGTSFDDKPRWGPDGKIIYFVSTRAGVANVWARRFDDVSGTPIGDAFPVTSFRSPQFQLTPRTVQMEIGVTSTHLLLPMSESRSEIWMLNEADR